MVLVRKVYTINDNSLKIGNIQFRGGMYVTSDEGEQTFLESLKDDNSLNLQFRELKDGEVITPKDVVDRDTTIKTGVLTFTNQFAGGQKDVQIDPDAALAAQLAAASNTKAAEKTAGLQINLTQ